MEAIKPVTRFRRVFLLEDLPEPLTRASEHLQFFDRYLDNSDLRLRLIRNPKTKEWTRLLEKRLPLDEGLNAWNVSELPLSEQEHAYFEQMIDDEIRKNRYFYEYEGRMLEIDVYLGALWGLCIAKAHFETQKEMQEFEAPAFAVSEVTENKFYLGKNLVTKSFADIQAEFSSDLAAANS